MANETGDSSAPKNVKVSGSVDARFTPEFLKDVRTGQQQEHTRESNRFKVEIGTLLIVMVYTSVAIWQGCSNQKSAEAAKSAADAAQGSLNSASEHYKADNRPYISQSIKSTAAPTWYPSRLDSSKGQILWDWHYTNFGKTPAQNITFTQEMKLEGKGWVPTQGENGPSVAPPQLQGQDTSDTVISEEITRKEFDRLMQITDGISMRVKISYTGFDGAPYETGLCLSRTNTGSITYCKNDNYIH